jgi:hypothetical protein
MGVVRTLFPLCLCLGATHGFPNLMMRRSAKSLAPDFVSTPFPQGILGTWLPSAPPQAILGPLAYDFVAAHDGAFSAQRDPRTGDVWFTVLAGQVFRVREKQMQCATLTTLFPISAANHNGPTCSRSHTHALTRLGAPAGIALARSCSPSRAPSRSVRTTPAAFSSAGARGCRACRRTRKTAWAAAAPPFCCPCRRTRISSNSRSGCPRR